MVGSVSDLAYDLHIHFLTNGFTWDGEVPSVEKIEEALMTIKDTLESHPEDGITMFGGRLAVQKNNGHLDVYAHFGDYNDSTV